MVFADLDKNTGNKFLEESCSQLDFDYIDYNELNYSEFFNRYILLNKPCVVRSVTEHWNCKKDWIENSSINFTRLLNDYGEANIPTANCKEQYYNSHAKQCMQLKNYLEYWKQYIESGYSDDMPSLYLKDWHCFKEYPEKDLYRVPQYFISDWLNEYYLSHPELNDDYRFVYMGPKNTWTPLHKDVFSSFSWSVNVCGHKEWIFYPPDQLQYLSDKLGNIVFDINNVDCEKYPFIDKAKFCKLEQGPGDAVFVPSGWYHQVWNKADTISINHNWINGCNIKDMFHNLLSELVNVENELSEWKKSQDWTEDSQKLLKATFGLDINQFYNFIKFIIQRRIEALESNVDLNLPSGDSIGREHMKFDLKSCKIVASMLLNLNYQFINKNDIILLLNDINKIFNFG